LALARKRLFEGSLAFRFEIVGGDSVGRGTSVLLAAYLAARQVPRVVVVLYHIYRTALGRIAFHDRERAVGAEGFYHFRPSVEVVVMDFPDKNSVGVLLHEINLAVEIPIALDLHHLIVAEGPNQVRLPISVGVDLDLIFTGPRASHPLIGLAVGPTVSDDSSLRSLAGKKREH
jgi:hypothetical protein